MMHHLEEIYYTYGKQTFDEGKCRVSAVYLKHRGDPARAKLPIFMDVTGNGPFSVCV